MQNSGLTAGSVFANRFEIVGPAGEGGMGTVYRARDRVSGDTVALKLLHKGSSRKKDGSLRFDREAQLLSELHHPAIVAHITHGKTSEGQPFLIMEWLDGEDLDSRLLRGPLSLRDSLALVDRVAGGLAVAHERGILHRD